MKCSEIREQLPGFLYGDLSSEQHIAVAAHLLICVGCQQERDALEQVRTLLTLTPTPRVAVDVGDVYRQAAERERLRLRRWRRVALAACAGFAALLAITLTLNLHVRVEQHQLTLCWGEPREVSPPPAPPAPTPALVMKLDPSEQRVLEQRLRVLDDLIQMLALSTQTRDVEYQQAIDRLEKQIRGLQFQSVQQWTATERDVAALYAAQFLNRKGNQP